VHLRERERERERDFILFYIDYMLFSKKGERDIEFYTRRCEIMILFKTVVRKSLFQLLLNGTRFYFYFLRGCHIATGRRKAINICLQWVSAFPVEVDPIIMCPMEYGFRFVPWSPFNSATVNLSCIVWKKTINKKKREKI